MPVLESPSPALLYALLEGFGALTPAQAAAKAPGLLHSEAEPVAHAHFGRRRVLDAAEGWPAAEPGAWEGVRGVPGGPRAGRAVAVRQASGLWPRQGGGVTG